VNEGTKPDLQRVAAHILGPNGPLTTALEGFAPRQGQLAMAQAVAQALTEQTPLVVEAGTGTGKTLAYLAPVVASGLKTVVSTGVKTLQDQVAHKELPLLGRVVAPGLRWAVLKGRGNYLCPRRYLAFAAQPDLGLPGALSGLAALESWRRQSRSGDLDEVRGQAVGEALLAEITANAEQCLGGRCEHREDCPLMEARRRAAEADIVVVNHHLFLADLRLKAEGRGEALPRYQAVIFDEAHMLPEVATVIFGVGVSERRLSVLLKDMTREVGPDQRVDQAARAAEQDGQEFFGALRALAGPSGHRGLGPDELARIAPLAGALGATLDELAQAVGRQEGEEAKTIAARAGAVAMDLQAAVAPAPGHTVAWVERRGRGVAVNLSPVEVGPHLEHALYQEIGRLVFTSATMAAGDDLGPMIRRLGLPDEARRLIVDSPFDQARQSILYVPRRMPPPADPAFAVAVAGQLRDILRLSRGRAFVLFTSHRNMEEVSAMLTPELEYACLVQGQAPRLELLRRFVELSPSVLFATASFWQGVDVPGPALSAVIVDKLPFAPPDDPLVAARMALLESRGHNGFAHLMVPEAILSLKQGLGRLLRTPHDRGVLAVLDNRLLTKPYGRRFLKALAPAPLTSDLADVARFFADAQTEPSS